MNRLEGAGRSVKRVRPAAAPPWMPGDCGSFSHAAMVQVRRAGTAEVGGRFPGRGPLVTGRGNVRRFSVRGGFPFATAPGTDGVVTARAGGEPNAISLGHFPEYLDLGARTGARTCSVSDEAFNAMSPEEQWTSIRRFLDRAVEGRSEIRLATPLDAIRPGSFLEREVQYLFKNGFVPSADGTMLVPGAT